MTKKQQKPMKRVQIFKNKYLPILNFLTELKIIRQGTWILTSICIVKI